MSSHPGRQNTAASAPPVTPSDVADLPNAASCVGLYIGITGTIRFLDAARNTCNTTAQAGFFPIQVRKVFDTGTDADQILACHDECVVAS